MKKLYLLIPVFLTFIYSGFSQNCSSLEILTTTDASVCGEGSVTLSATSSGTGDDIYWYDAATAGNYLGKGSTFQTPPLTSTTSFWATEVIATGISGSVGPTDPSIGSTSSTSLTNHGLNFTVSSQVVLTSVDIFPTAAVGSNATILIRSGSSATGTIVATVPYTTTVSGSTSTPVKETINLNVPLSPGTYTMTQGTGITLVRNTTGAQYPYTTADIQVTGNTFDPDYWYFFYNWNYSTGSVTCESTREEVIATVNNQADENIATLPYTHTASTSTYANNYSGAPGTNCGTGDAYLNGNDVVYKYTANNDYILNVELSGLNKDHTAVFVYNSCNDIGTSCPAEGSVNENIGTHSFQVSVTNGSTYYFVVSSADPTDFFDYTLNITGTTCANYPAPNGSASQNFITGQTLADLDVTGPNITWYSDAPITMVIPTTTSLVNGTTYYATQTFQGCEGNVLAVTTTEVPCTALEVLTSIDNAVCGEGSVTLSAQGAEPAVNTDIFWYDAATGGNRIGNGNIFQTPVIDLTTSYWASEVVISGSQTAGQGLTTDSGTLSTTTKGGLMFTVTDAITIIDVEVFSTSAAGGPLEVVLQDIDNNRAIVASTTVIMPSGGSSASPVPVTVPLNFFVPPGNYALVKNSGPTFRYQSGSGVFPLPLGNSGSITGGATSTGTSTLYYLFYNWTIFEGQALCESPRKEVIATVNNVADEMVTQPLPFVHTASTSTYGNNYSGTPGNDCGTTEQYLNGNDVVYQFSPTTGAVYSVMLSGLTSDNAAIFIYESCYDIGTTCYAGNVSDGTTNNFGLAEVPMYDGFDYFIVISTKDSSTTDYTLTIDVANINCVDYTAAPGGDANQFFEAGDTLDDLVVYGGNLTWYSDAAGTVSIPSSTLLVDGSTYYVRQTLNTCVSDVLAITVTKINCSALEIVSTTDGTIVCKGSTVLEATGNGGLGTEVYWYDAPTNGDVVNVGPSYTTPILTNTTSYWATEVFIEGDAPISGQGKVAPTGTSSFGSTLNYGLKFDATMGFNINSVDVYPEDSGTLEISLFDSAGTLLQSASQTVTAGTGPVTVPLNFTVPIGTEYRLLQTSSPSLKLIRDSSGNSFPYPLGQAGELGAITHGTYGTGTLNSSSYYYFYNWTTGSGQILCESPRKEVIATVSQNGDIIVPSALPYIDANNNTTNYGNTFTGLPGTTCGTTENYLNGDDVVYMYTPTMNDVVDITLKDITGFYAGLFVYESCGDIGTTCVAGKVAGADKNNLEIKEFDMVAGQTYYIVISSWLSANIGYTLEIKGFDCSLFPAPIGDAAQDFVAPQTLADLQVTGTMSTSVLNWYSDAAGTISIPDNTPLVNATTYYVSQTFGTCEGPLLAITVTEIDCSDLEILTTTGGSATCKGAITLSATASGTGSDIYWYSSASALDPISFGPTYTTPPITTTTSYWVSEVLLESGTGTGGPLPTYCVPTFSIGCTSGDLIDDFILTDSSGNTLLSHLASGCSPNGYGDYTSDASLTATLIAGQTYDFTSVANFSSQRIKIWIDLDKDGNFNDNDELLFTSPSSANPTIGSFTIPQSAMGSTTVMRVFDRYSSAPTDACSTGNSFGEVHDYKVVIVGAAMICESPRKEVIATINQTGDKLVGALNYTDTDSTINFGNNFSGTPGCGITGNYLDGNDVVYKYSPTADDIVNIELTGVSNSKTGVFVYDSCGNVGSNCLGGAISNGGVYKIEDFYATAGEEYYIVIASETGSTSYTLNIYGYDCTADLNPPTGDATQYFVGTKDLTDLDVDQYVHSTGLTWYSNAAGTSVIPNTTPLVDNTTYYVSQTVLGCESDLLAITALEFDCSDLEIISTTTGSTVCQSGSVTLTAQAGGIGNEIYWFPSYNSTSPINIGSTFTTPNITTTTSYWVAEVYTEGGTGTSGPLPTYCIPTFSFGCTSGDVIDDFTLKSQSGNTLLSHIASGCSPNAYGDYTSDPNLTATLVAGQTYDFTSVANFSSQRIKIWIDLNKDGIFDDTRELLFSSPSGNNPTNGNITIPFDAVGNTTVMRVFDSYSSLPTDACTSASWGEVHDYKVTIVGASVLCESTREEVIVEVNNTLPPAPVGDAIQNVCGADSTIADLKVIGDNIKWYDAQGTLLSLNTIITGGESYFATQTVAACEGPQLEVAVVLLDKSEKPVGDRNQAYYDGETLVDLVVIGYDLLWYADIDKMIPLPDTTLLVDQTTYYVSQTLGGFCESELLPITVHRVLGTNGPAFANVMVLPNPASDRVTISNNGPIEFVELYNLLGQRIIAQSAGFRTETVMDVSFLSSGTYLLNVKIDGKIGIFKVIKE